MLRSTLLSKFKNSNPAIISLTIRPEYNVRVRFPQRRHKDFADSMLDYKRLLKEYRAKNISEHWERQNQVENQFIERWEKQQEEKYKRDLVKFRDSVVRISAATERHIQDRIKNEDRKIRNINKFFLEEQEKKANRIKMLKFLNLDSKTWYTSENIETKMKAEVLIPDFVYDQSNYFIKLQEQAIHYENADFDGLEESMNDSEVIRLKNMKLMPLFSELVSLIKHISRTDENAIAEEYHHLKNVLLAKEDMAERDRQEKLNKLKESYSALYHVQLEENEQTANKLNILSKQSILLYNLVDLWQRYIDIAKMENASFMEIINLERRKEGVKIMTVDQLQEEIERVKAEKASKYSDALTSADEKFTTGSSEESDLEGKQIEKMDPTNPNFFKEALKGQKSATDKELEENSETERLLKGITEKDKFNFIEEFESEFKQSIDKDRFLYGLKQDKEAIEISNFLKENPIKSFVPERAIEDIKDFTKARLRFQNLEDIEDDQYLIDEENYHKLNSSAIIEIQKKQLDELSQREGLSRKDKHKLKDLKSLFNKIGEIRIQEPKLLMKIFEVYNTQKYID